MAQQPHEPLHAKAYADWLQDRDDPRGEVLALQIKRRELGLSEREAEQARMLREQVEPRWLNYINVQ
jgi:uncharacterized protein (TIGR02996 family)